MLPRRGGVAHKKLKAVAAVWARPGRRGGWRVDPDDPNAAELAAYLAEREGGRGAVRDNMLGIAPDEVEAVALFMALDTQWRWHPMAGARTGIDYGAIASVAAASGIAVTPELFLDIRSMEASALNTWAKAK